MKVHCNIGGSDYQADLSSGESIAIPLQNGSENPNCFWAPMPEFSPVRADGFVGSTAEGGPLNFFNVRFNPHGNGTHTECYGHISNTGRTIVESLSNSHFTARLISLYPEKAENGDRIFQKHLFEDISGLNQVDALIIRSLPNTDLKKLQTWSGSNPPYLHHEAIEYLVDQGIHHLLIDLPSVDREEDGGALLGHRAFWGFTKGGGQPAPEREDATITEMVYVPDSIKDGLYLLNLQIAAFQLDVSPSRPTLYSLSPN